MPGNPLTLAPVQRRAYDGVKRAIDIVASLSALIVLSPVLLAVALLVRVRLGSPVLFRQVRPGLNERLFEMIKFRSMRDALGHDGWPLPDAERLTPLGRWLRSTSLDELPELWNVLKGDMSLVGPRPLLVEYIGYYTDEEQARFSVRPGITGLAQINGRNETSWDARLAYDICYARGYSLGLDLRILFKTVAKVIRRDGVVVAPSQIYCKLNDERAR
jgi:lipopolysaccharide/colanic/teichoic acid biosynthesis glycosyltransferase